MVVREFCIRNEYGLHARPASLFCDMASKYKSNIMVLRDGIEADGKSVISILLLEVYSGLSIKVEIDGPDEKEAMAALTELIDRDFNV